MKDFSKNKETVFKFTFAELSDLINEEYDDRIIIAVDWDGWISIYNENSDENLMEGNLWEVLSRKLKHKVFDIVAVPCRDASGSYDYDLYEYLVRCNEHADSNKRVSDIAKEMEANPEIIAQKIWIRADIASILEEQGSIGTEDNVDEVLNFLDISALVDCTDTEWDAIHSAVEQAKKANVLS